MLGETESGYAKRAWVDTARRCLHPSPGASEVGLRASAPSAETTRPIGPILFIGVRGNPPAQDSVHIDPEALDARTPGGREAAASGERLIEARSGGLMARHMRRPLPNGTRAQALAIRLCVWWWCVMVCVCVCMFGEPKNEGVHQVESDAGLRIAPSGNWLSMRCLGDGIWVGLSMRRRGDGIIVGDGCDPRGSCRGAPRPVLVRGTGARVDPVRQSALGSTSSFSAVRRRAACSGKLPSPSGKGRLLRRAQCTVTAPSPFMCT